MQIFDDKKKRIGTLSGFKDRAITTTLDSGDKELTFDYPASGALVDLLKEEYYIRTKTDEFVLKAVEKGEQFNKYTAVLNVEELEGTAFPYGFESDEQTIKACLEFAFEGTGWHVGTCTVTKKRTIDEQESVTAWDVLQKCLTTYRCECIIHSLTKTIDIYDRIGSDRGCYFMEGLNLRKISLKSDTYDFYTRIYPIGKDGITPEWLTGKDYIDNFQYSSKIKAYVWKDERYTNTTSLIEDATAKIEEMSRPYKAYTAEVVDLAKASEKYKDILSYGIGDTVKSTALRLPFSDQENNRIVFSALFWLSHNSEYFCFSIQHSYILNMYLDAANGISQFYFCKPCILHLLSIYIFINISHKTMIICHPSRPPQTSIFWCDYMLVLWLICNADISALCITEL